MKSEETVLTRTPKKQGAGEAVRQSLVVMKNEIKKFFSGKRMMVFSLILAAIIFVIAVAPYLVGSEAKPFMFVSIASLVVLMASTLFASISIVSEYEERTALIVFTRPISKFSIFTGKMLACLVVTIGFTLLYYVVAMIVGLLVDHSVSADMWVSFGMACAYAFATTGIAMLVSSLLKKASTSTILTFVVLAVIFMALSMVLGAAGTDTSWLLNDASESIEYASSDYRDFTNDMLNDLAQMLSSPASFFVLTWRTVIESYGTVDPDTFLTMVKSVWAMGGTEEFNLGQVTEPDYAYHAIVMIVWGLLGLVGAFVAFLKREF